MPASFKASNGQSYPIAGEDHATPQDIGGDDGIGYLGRDLSKYPLHSMSTGQYTTTLIDPASYADRINEKKDWLPAIYDSQGGVILNQRSSSYCWGHATVGGMQHRYCLQGGLMLPLSAFYGCAIIKGGRNQGGSGIESVQWLSQNGTCLESMHQSMNFSPNNTPEAKANAALHKITEYEEFDSGDHGAIITNVLNNNPVTVGIPAWGHEVIIVALVYDKAQFSWNNGVGYLFQNSWGVDYGNHGRGVLSRSYSRFDEAGSIRAVTQAVE
jgi:hypothetical protein